MPSLAPVRPAGPDSRDDDHDEPGGKMSFLEHLDELRRRLVVSVVSLLVGFLVSLVFVDRVFAFVMRPLQQVLPDGAKLVYTEPAEAFMMYMKVAALMGLFLALPIVLLQLWLFVAPGLYANEKRFAVPFVLFSTIFFAGGAVFSHYAVFPWAWKFFAGFGNDYMQFLPKIGPVFSLYVRMMLAMGVVFQMPTLVMFLARVGVITPRFLIRHTKYAILVIFVVAAVLTPSPDVVTQLLMAGPMILLYGLSIAVAWIFKKRRPDEADDARA
jgi:sec-independent protein translocase protein TatC